MPHRAASLGLQGGVRPCTGSCIDTPLSGQVLVYSPSSNLERIRACLEAAHTSILPENCSRTIYLLDTQQYACIAAPSRQLCPCSYCQWCIGSALYKHRPQH